MTGRQQTYSRVRMSQLFRALLYAQEIIICIGTLTIKVISSGAKFSKNTASLTRILLFNPGQSSYADL